MSNALSVLDEISTARLKLDYGPLSSRTLRAARVLRAPSSQERVLDGAIGYLANLIVAGAASGSVRFCEVTSEEDWRAVRELRLRSYPVSLPYLVGVLEPDGSDRHDRHSFVYAAFVGGRAVATVRATAYPYEVLEHLREETLAAYLGDGWRSDYIEWGRLLVDHDHKKLRLTPALLTYAGLRLLASTPYRRYFGYTRPHVRGIVSRFAIQPDTLRFEIPSRGDHHYLLTKGSLGAGAVREVPKWLRRASERIVGLEAAAPAARAVAQ